MEQNVAIKVSPVAEGGIGFDHVGATRFRMEHGMPIKPFDKYTDKNLELMGVGCNTSTSTKLDKHNLDGEDQDLEEQNAYASKK